MIHDGLLEESQIDDMGDILLGKKPKRQSKEEIVIYSVGGMPVEDVAWGKVCYDNAVKKGIGTKLHLWDQPYMW